MNIIFLVCDCGEEASPVLQFHKNRYRYICPVCDAGTQRPWYKRKMKAVRIWNRDALERWTLKLMT